jgi:hypothetical protein
MFAKEFIKLETPIRGNTEKAVCVSVQYTDGKKANKTNLWFPKSWVTVVQVSETASEVYLELWQVERALDELKEKQKLNEPTFNTFYSICDESKNAEITEIKANSKKA